MEAPLDSWEEKRGGLTPAEAYRCWLFGDGLEAGMEASGGMNCPDERIGPGPSPLHSGSALPVAALPEGARRKRGFSKERVEAVLKSGGKLTRGELLRCRVRWFSDGAAIGSKAFVEGVFTACREHFGAKRKMGARKVGQDSAGTLHSLRKLRVNPVG